MQQEKSSSSLNTAYYGIRWAHRIGGFSSPTDHSLVSNILEAGKRRLARPVNKKQPITPELLTSMFGKLYEPENLFNQRTIAMCLLSYAGFLRSSELLKIERSDCFSRYILAIVH